MKVRDYIYEQFGKGLVQFSARLKLFTNEVKMLNKNILSSIKDKEKRNKLAKIQKELDNILIKYHSELSKLK